jgi:hypothetical protein
MLDDLKSLEDEVRQLEESVTQSAQNQLEQAKLWRGVNVVFGVPEAALAAIAGGTGLAGVAGRSRQPSWHWYPPGWLGPSRRSTLVGV